jgi:uncharacterized protein (DUF2147 family)
MRIRAALAVGLIVAAATGARSACAGESTDPIGFWLTEDGSAVVQIAACGPALCGTIVWSQKAADAKGRPLCGRAILGEAIATGGGTWAKGWIYSPRTDDKYAVALTLSADGKLRLHISAGLFGKDQTWTRPAQAITPCTP